MSGLFNDPTWDSPFFKVLANNDTLAAAGHQAGIVITKPIFPFFPGLIGKPSQTTPTIDERLVVELFMGLSWIETVSARYQYQTWGGKRAPEYRVTGNLKAIRAPARGDDLLVMQRALTDLRRFRFFLFTHDDPLFSDVTVHTKGRRAGPLIIDRIPVSASDLSLAVVHEKTIEASLFDLFDSGARLVTSTTTKVARSIAFKETLLDIYNFACCICGSGMNSPTGIACEAQAAHIVPRSKLGADDARNGLALCATHHWAFDAGLIGIADGGEVIVPESVATMPVNSPLLAIRGRTITKPNDVLLEPSLDAIRWHRANVLIK